MERRNCFCCCTFTVTLFIFQGLWLTTHGLALKTRAIRSSPVCPNGWDAFGNKCYQMFGGTLHSDRATWPVANRKCEDIGSTLVSIHSSEEQAYITEYVARVESDIWIGLHLPAFQKKYQWTDETPLDFTYWEEGEPNYFNAEEECVHMNYVGTVMGKWNDHRCVRVFPYICQIPIGGCGGDINVARGVISSPNYPQRYAPNAECIWRITVPEDYQVSLRFSTFKVEEDSECSYDYVKVFDGHESSSPILGKFCGSDNPDVILSSGNTMSIMFKSDSSYQYEGFSAAFQKDTAESVEIESLLRQLAGAIAQPKIRKPK